MLKWDGNWRAKNTPKPFSKYLKYKICRIKQYLNYILIIINQNTLSNPKNISKSAKKFMTNYIWFPLERKKIWPPQWVLLNPPTYRPLTKLSYLKYLATERFPFSRTLTQLRKLFCFIIFLMNKRFFIIRKPFFD